MSLIASPYLGGYDAYGYGGYGAPFLGGSVMGLRRGGTMLGRPHRVRKSRNILVPPALPVAAPLLGMASTTICAPAIVDTHCAPVLGTSIHNDVFLNQSLCGSAGWI